MVLMAPKGGAGRQLEREICRFVSACGACCLLWSPLSLTLACLAVGFHLPLLPAPGKCLSSPPVSHLDRALSTSVPPFSCRSSYSRPASLSLIKMDPTQDTPSADHQDDQKAKSSYVDHVSPSTPLPPSVPSLSQRKGSCRQRCPRLHSMSRC